MTLAIDASTPTGVSTSTTAVSTASFTPAADSVLVAVVAVGNSSGGAATYSTVTDSLGSTDWQLVDRYGVSATGTDELWIMPAGSSPAARTVTATGQTATSKGICLQVFVLTGTTRPIIRNLAAYSEASGVATVSVPVSFNGSLVVSAISRLSGTAFTAAADNTIAVALNDGTNGSGYAIAYSTAMRDKGNFTAGFVGTATGARLSAWELRAGAEVPAAFDGDITLRNPGGEFNIVLAEAANQVEAVAAGAWGALTGAATATVSTPATIQAVTAGAWGAMVGTATAVKTIVATPVAAAWGAMVGTATAVKTIVVSPVVGAWGAFTGAATATVRTPIQATTVGAWGALTGSVTAGLVFGTTDASGTSPGGLTDTLVATKYTLPHDGMVTALHYYSLEDGNVKAAIYADSSGTPGALMVSNNVATAVVGNQWNPVDVADTFLTAGVYWITFLEDQDSMRAWKAGGTNQAAYKTGQSFASGMPSTWTPTGYQNNDYVAYGDYAVLVTVQATAVGAWGALTGSATAVKTVEALAFTFAALPGTSGNYISTPDSTPLDITGDISIVARVALFDWSTSGGQVTLVSKWQSGTQRSYRTTIENGFGFYTLEWSTTGANNVASSGIPTRPTGTWTWKWIGFTLDVNDGSGNRNVRLWFSDDGVNWTLEGGGTPTAGVTSIFNSTSIVEIGSDTAGTANLRPLRVGLVQIRSGIGAAGAVGGTVVAEFTPSDWVSGTTITSRLTGEVWSLNGTASISIGGGAWGGWTGAATAVKTVEAVAAGAWSGATATAAAVPTVVVHPQTQIFVPLYVYPSYLGWWNPFYANPPDWGIVNVASGPGTVVNSDYTLGIDTLRGLGSKLIGYVDTNFGARAIADVKIDIDYWLSLYNVDGIFFDRTPSTTSSTDIAYMLEASNYAKAAHAGWKVCFNHGTYPLVSDYIDQADFSIVFENTYTIYTAFTNIPAYAMEYVGDYPEYQWVHLVHSCTSEADMRDSWARANAFGVLNFHATSDLYFAEIPTYYDEEFTLGQLPAAWGALTATATATVSGIPTVEAVAAGAWGALVGAVAATVLTPVQAVAAGPWGALTATATAVKTVHATPVAGAWGGWTGSVAATPKTPVQAVTLGAWGGWTALATAVRTLQATPVIGAWGALTATATAVKTVQATPVSGAWGALTGSATATVKTPVQAVVLGAWGVWTGSAIAVPRVEATPVVGVWGALTATATAVKTVQATPVSGAWGGWTATAGATSVGGTIEAIALGAWGQLTAAATAVRVLPVTVAGAWGGWTAAATATRLYEATSVGSWGAWTATATALPTIEAAVAGAWGSLTGAVTATQKTPVQAVAVAAWGAWSADVAATPIVEATSVVGAWGGWTTAVAATPIIGVVATAAWGSWSAAATAAAIREARATVSIAMAVSTRGVKAAIAATTDGAAGDVTARAMKFVTGKANDAAVVIPLSAGQKAYLGRTGHTTVAVGLWVTAVGVKTGIVHTDVIAGVSAKTTGRKSVSGNSQFVFGVMTISRGRKEMRWRATVGVAGVSFTAGHKRGLSRPKVFVGLSIDQTASKQARARSQIPLTLTAGTEGVKRAIGSGQIPVIGFTNKVVIGATAYIHVLLRFLSRRPQPGGAATQGQVDGFGDDQPGRVSGRGTQSRIKDGTFV